MRGVTTVVVLVIFRKIELSINAELLPRLQFLDRVTFGPGPIG